MANMLNIGVSGLNAAQVALSTVGNNLANLNTDGYSRETVIQSEQIGQPNGRYTIGGGVNVESVQRAYSSYLTTAVWQQNSSLQRADTYNNLNTALNGVLTGSGNLQGSLDDFYAAFSTLANSAGNSSSRTALLGSAGSTAALFNTLGQQLNAQQTQVNSQISNTVNSINDAASKIASLNAQIRQTAPGQVPNAILDQRDSLVKSLSGYVGISTVAEDDGSISIYTSSGQSLVAGNKSFAMSAGNNAYDPGQTDVFDSAGNDTTTKLSGGSLGALLDYRNNVLNPAQNQLGQAAVALSSSINAQQAKGLDLSGNLGSPIFNAPTPTVLASSRNTGTTTVSASISDVSKLTASDYTLSYDGTAWNLRTSSGQSVPTTTNPDGSFSADGLTFNVGAGTAQAGDSFVIQPTRDAATSLKVVQTDPGKIAAAAALTATPASSNNGGAKLSSINVTDSGNAALLSNAKVTFTSASAYQVTDGSGNVLASGTYTAGQPITANGWSLTLTGTPAANDSFNIAANSNGLNDNSNALAMAALADGGVLNGGKTSVLDSYANLTTFIGTAGSQAASNLSTQTSLYNQAMSAQQSVSGVNMDEEAASMVKYQQAYQASAQIITTAQTIFASLLQAVQG
ncbi:flagellar hook-associated protein FlgK [Dyella sp.]|uniref:flagellar hook-associated protein FlgK n=1 Tax=Dyella sp. TaxID=1869338 RepID=UPI002ED19C84